MRKFLVGGGVHTDTSFEQVVEGAYEDHGMYDNYEEAKSAWWKATCKNVDICEHRIFIMEVLI